MNQDTYDPIAQLRDELGRVTVSRDFADRVRERLSDDLEPLRAELSDLTVSPEFAVRVRQSVEATRRPSWRLGFNWRWTLPASAGLAAAIAAVALWPRQPIAPAPVTAVARVEPAAPAAVTSSTPQPVPSPSVVTANRAVAPRRVEAGSSDPAKPRDPFLEVVTDQPELLRRLQVSIERPVSLDATEPTGMYEAPKLEVPKVEVSPISVFVVPNPRLPLGMSPFILRIAAADSAERSSK